MLSTALRVTLVSCLPLGPIEDSAISAIQSAFNQFPSFKEDPDQQTHLWSTLVSLFQQNQNTWGKIFKLHKILFQHVYRTRRPVYGPPVIWSPPIDRIHEANITEAMKKFKFSSYAKFHEFSFRHQEQFWDYTLKRLQVQFHKPPTKILHLPNVENPVWFPGASMNIIDSCFVNKNPESTAISYASEGSPKITNVTWKELEELVNRVVNGLIENNFKTGDRLAINMPMTVEAVAIYLGVIKAGMAVIGIADSFAPKEIEKRNSIAKAAGIFCVDSYTRAGKDVLIYPKVIEANSPRAIVISFNGESKLALRNEDISWEKFLSAKTQAKSVPVDPYAVSNVLFSSGTTGDPKAIPWTHVTPIKAAADAFYHHDIHSGDVVCWPTNLGWMMGPWLIYAAFINKASIALYYGAPTNRNFADFVCDSKVTMLGLIPTIVKTWRVSKSFDDVSFQNIKVFSSTGECSNTSDYMWLMSLAQFKAPVIEYCGGTEIGGAYVTGTVIQDAALTMFTTPAIGVDFKILGQSGAIQGEGEAFIVPPSLGISQSLLNRDHSEVYYADCPSGPNEEVLRRHGDILAKLPNGFFTALGRVDDTMNLGGIKISSAELERAALLAEDLTEVAAIGIPTKQGDRLVLFVIPENREKSPEQIQKQVQAIIAKHLNPLFKIYQLVVVNELPKTASNKVMRRTLRDQYVTSQVVQPPKL